MSVVLSGWILLSLGFYYLPVVGGKHWFKGPVANVDRDDMPVDATERRTLEESSIGKTSSDAVVR